MKLHSRFQQFRLARPSQAGFTLVELMVGLAIGMLATLVVMQVFSVFEIQKRSTTGTADAQTNGNIALYEVTRDLQLAGYGLVPEGKAGKVDTSLECPGVWDLTNASAVAAGASAVISPVAIADGGSGTGGDSITIHYGDTLQGGVPTPIKAPPAGSDIIVDATVGCNAGDFALVMNWSGPGVCAMTKVASIDILTKKITFIDSSAMTKGAAVSGARVACLGKWNTITYSVNPVNGNLLRGTEPIVSGIVNLQAQYGIADPLMPSTSPDFNKVVQWVNATGATWGSPTVADRNRIKAVRIAIVARNSNYEPNIVSSACTAAASSPTGYIGVCSWDPLSAAPRDASPAPVIDLHAVDPNFGHYRYKVFETIIPLRNVIWAKGTL